MGGQHRGGTLCVEPRGGLLACVCVCRGRVGVCGGRESGFVSFS